MIPAFIFLPSSSYTLRFILEAIFLVVFNKKIATGIKRKYFIILIPFISLSALQSISTLNIFDFLEVARYLSVLIMILILGKQDSKILERSIVTLVIINFIAMMFNFSSGSIILTELKINNMSIIDTYGRNSGAFASLTSAAFLSISAVYFFVFVSTKHFLSKSIILGISVLNLIFTGSKTAMVILMVIGVFYVLQFIFLLTIRKKIKFFHMIIMLQIMGIFIWVKQNIESLQFLIQIDRLGAAIASRSASSVSARFQLWMDYFNVQIDNVFYIIFGVPKIVLKEINSTFDSDYVWIIVRLGFPAAIIISIYLLRTIYGFLKQKNFLLVGYIVVTMLSALLSGVLTDPQSILIFATVFLAIQRKENFIIGMNK